MIKKIVVTMAIGLTLNGYWTYRTVKFGKASEEYFKYLELRTNCLEDLSNELHWEMPEANRRALKRKNSVHPYHTNIASCKKLAQHRCWAIDFKDPENMERCHKNIMTDEEYDTFKKTGKSPWETKNGK